MSDTPITFVDRITAEIGRAAKQRDAVRLGTLRMLKAALLNREIERGRPLDEREAQQVVAALVKQRRDSIDQFERAGRHELAEKERAEIGVLEALQPPAAGPEEIDAAVERAIGELGATSVRDMGAVMKRVMAALDGRTFDGRAVSERVRARLSG